MSSRLNSALLIHELEYTTSRSSGPGGQNVNKVNTKVTLKWDVRSSSLLSDEEREVVLTKLKSRITSDGVLMLISQEKRSQLQNKEEALKKLDDLLRQAFTRKKQRKATKPTKSSSHERVEKKKQHSEKKKWRQKLQE